MNDKLKELDAVVRLITGKGLTGVVNDIIVGKSEQEMMLEVSEHVRQQHEKSDTLRNAIEEMERAGRAESGPGERKCSK